MIQVQLTPPRTKFARKRFTIKDLPAGALDNGDWKKLVSSFIDYVAGSTINVWSAQDADLVNVLQTIWNHIYGARVPHTVRAHGEPVFYLVSSSPSLTLCCSSL